MTGGKRFKHSEKRKPKKASFFKVILSLGFYYATNLINI